MCKYDMYYDVGSLPNYYFYYCLDINTFVDVLEVTGTSAISQKVYYEFHVKLHICVFLV